MAADDAVRWLQVNNSSDALRSKEGLGVQLELAKNILAQLPSVEDPAAKSAGIKKATDTLTQVVRYSSPYKPEAIELLKKYKPRAASNATDIVKLNYEEAVSTGESAISSQEWDRAIPPDEAGDQAGRAAQGHRQGQLRALQPRLLLLHDEAVLRGAGDLRPQ